MTTADLDPELEPLRQLDDGSLNLDTLAGVRALIAAQSVGVPAKTVERAEHTVPSDPPVAVRVHRRVGAGIRRPAVVRLHAGGFVFGTIDNDAALLDRWCDTFDLIGITVEYRLAPEDPYPAALEDCYAALTWLHRHADELGIDADRIGVSGTSAGGALAAALAMLARDRAEVPVAFQHLDAAMLDDRQQTPSSQEPDLLVWGRDVNAFGWRSYLGERYGSHDVPAYAAPARATDLTRLPPAFVSVGALDGFRDEDIDYATRLNQAGVATELHVYPGAPHGYLLMRNAAVVRRTQRDVEDWLARQLGSAPRLP